MKYPELYNPFSSPVIYKESCESTMNEAVSLEKPRHGTVIFTSYQTAGRGRGKNRTWCSPKGNSLLFTVVVDPEKTVHPPVRIPLISALALGDMLEDRYGIKSLLKWPNDVLVSEKKISGILCEYRGGRILAGIGINLKQRVFPDEIGNRATSMELEGASEVEPFEVLESFLYFFRERLECRQWREEAEQVLYGKDEVLEVLEGGTENPRLIRIRILGLDDDGFLMVRDCETGGEKHLKAGEISFQGFGEFR